MHWDFTYLAVRSRVSCHRVRLLAVIVRVDVAGIAHNSGKLAPRVELSSSMSGKLSLFSYYVQC